MKGKKTPTSFSPVTSENIRIGPLGPQLDHI